MLPSDEFHARTNELEDVAPSYWDWATNSLGSLGLEISRPDYGSMIYRVHDLDAQIVLLRVMARALGEEVAEEGMDAFLQRLGPGLRNPYDGSAAVYEGGVLRFEVDRSTYDDPPAFVFTPRG